MRFKSGKSLKRTAKHNDKHKTNFSNHKGSSLGNSRNTEKISVYKRINSYPKPYSGSPFHTSSGFMEPSDGDIYNSLVGECYHGFRVDGPGAHSQSFHDDFRQAFESLESNGFFQFDYTQPHGLNTRVSKTFVTRCLVGQPGITYKYLGLRMFSFPWNSNEVGSTSYTQIIKKLNSQLIKRSQQLLKELNRSETGPTEYNLTLINSCIPASKIKLKEEPYYSTKSKDKCSVSWHADSSLEHFSSIGVYNALKDRDSSAEQNWRVAMRVEHDAEGPRAGKLKTLHNKEQSKAKVKSNAPPIAVPLLDGYSYHLLDDFNHHHQHAVLAGSVHRWSSTHRVGRCEGHTYSYILAKVKTVVDAPRRNNAKHLRSAQLALSEVEFEWIRQFYSQGKNHYALHEWWHEPMATLVGLWTQLESRMAKEVEDLELASKGIAALQTNIASLPQEERRKKNKKLIKTVKRLQTVEVASYDVLIEGISERSVRRAGWNHREKELSSAGAPPMEAPLFHTDTYKESGGLGNDSNNLMLLQQNLKRWKKDFAALPSGAMEFIYKE
jgi:mRNA N6-methyladenine demethylase